MSDIHYMHTVADFLLNTLRLLRVKHYVKNLLIFFPLVFSCAFFNTKLVIANITGFGVFCALSSFIYIINDMRDIDNDRKHPTKRKRPLASGAVSLKQARILTFILLFTAVYLSYLTDFSGLFLLIAYILINLLYSFGGKNVPLLDVILLTAGYMLRLYYGGALTNVPVSDWMFLTVMCAAAFLGFGKRRNELIYCGNKGRKILQSYNIEFLDHCFILFEILTITFYSLTCADKNTTVSQAGLNLMWTVPLVVIIVLRYNLLLETKNSDGDPVNVVLKDSPILLLIILYAAGCAAVFLSGVAR